MASAFTKHVCDARPLCTGSGWEAKGGAQGHWLALALTLCSLSSLLPSTPALQLHVDNGLIGTGLARLGLSSKWQMLRRSRVLRQARMARRNVRMLRTCGTQQKM